MNPRYLLIIIPGVILLLLILSQQNISFSYTKTIETSYSSEQLWNQLTNTLKDSKTSSFWPNQKEEVSSTNLVPNGTLEVLYKLPFGQSQQRYTISDIRYGIVSYQTTNSHPLRGGGTISVIPRQNGSALSWRIEYSYGLFNVAGWYVRYRYTPAFFDILQKNLATQWSNITMVNQMGFG